jgi:hypothetical protein
MLVPFLCLDLMLELELLCMKVRSRVIWGNLCNVGSCTMQVKIEGIFSELDILNLWEKRTSD